MLALKSAIPLSLHRLFDNLIEGVMIIDTKGLIVYHNQRSCQILRCVGQKIRETHVDTVFEQLALIVESKKQLGVTIKRYLEQEEEIKNATMAFKTIYGTSGNLALSFFPLDLSDSEEKLWILSFLDITEGLRDKLHRTRFVRVVGHELKHPLSSLKAYLYMIRKRITDDSEKTQRYLKQADEQIDVLTAMLNDLTDISKISLQEFEVDPEDQVLQPLVEKVVADFQVAHPDRHIKMALGDKQTQLMIDGIRFRQVLNNILSNAVRYSNPETDIVVKVVEKTDVVDLTISDKGEGISSEDLERIFDAYYRTKQGYQHKGLGLGLYIAKEVMRRHDGSIHIDSKKGKGTTVTLRFQR